MRLLAGQRRDGQRGGTFPGRPEAIADQRQVAAIELGIGAPRGLDHRSQRELDEHEIRPLEILANRALPTGPVDDGFGKRGKPLARQVKAPPRAAVEDLGEATVLALHPQRALEVRGEPLPGVWSLKCVQSERGHLVEVLLEDGVDQFVLVGEAAVDGAHADAGVRGDVVERHLEAARSEDLSGGREDARAFGATDIVEGRGEEAVSAVMDRTAGVGVDATLECVGTGQAMDTALAIARPFSTVGYVGVPHGVELPVDQMFFANKGVLGGPAPARAYIPELLDDVLEGRVEPGRVFDFTTDLDGVADAYAAMDDRRAIKSLIRVGTV